MSKLSVENNSVILRDDQGNKTVLESCARREEAYLRLGMQYQYFFDHQIIVQMEQPLQPSDSLYISMGKKLRSKPYVGFVCSTEIAPFSLLGYVSLFMGKGLTWRAVPNGQDLHLIKELAEAKERIEIIIPSSRNISKQMTQLTEEYDDVSIQSLHLGSIKDYKEMMTRHDEDFLGSLGALITFWNTTNHGKVFFMRRKARNIGVPEIPIDIATQGNPKD